jgi:hypothetical protein
MVVVEGSAAPAAMVARAGLCSSLHIQSAEGHCVRCRSSRRWGIRV